MQPFVDMFTYLFGTLILAPKADINSALNQIKDYIIKNEVNLKPIVQKFKDPVLRLMNDGKVMKIAMNATQP